MKQALLISVFLLLMTGSAFAVGGQQKVIASLDPPPQAANVGYTLSTFSTNMSGDIDLTNSKAPGYKLYLWNLFGYHGSAAAITENYDGTITLNGIAGTSYEANVLSATPTGDANVFSGKAFGGGGYFEATLKFDPYGIDGVNGWPAWWALAYSGSVISEDQWPGQATNYRHNVEIDFFEFFGNMSSTKTDYGGIIHDWYGVYGVTCSPGLCKVSSTNSNRRTYPGVDFNQFHKYGFLWVPATETTQGYAKFFFDDVQQGDAVVWSVYDGEVNTPPPVAPWLFGVLDQQKLVLIVGTGKNQPLIVKSVRVWQKDETQNISR